MEHQSTEGEVTLEVRYSDVEGATDIWPGEGNILCDPNFLADGYHLDYTCMLLNKGISTINIGGITYNSPLYDIDGDLRPYAGEAPEIGADELMTAVPIARPIPGQSLSIYPNPASDKIIIDLANVVLNPNNLVSVTDITGKELISRKVNSPKMEMDINSLPAGVYCIKLISKDQNAAISVEKFVKY